MFLFVYKEDFTESSQWVDLRKNPRHRQKKHSSQKLQKRKDLQRKGFKKGDVAFMTSNGSICFFLNDTDYAKTMTPIGKIVSNVDALNEVKPGDIFLITQAG